MNKQLSYAVVISLCLIGNASALSFIAHGDTRSNITVHKKIIDEYSKRGPELVINTGDLWDGYGSTVFKSALESNPVTRSLLAQNKYLVSRGNHESESAVLGFQPSLVRNNAIRYSFSQGDCFFVSLGYDPALNLTWLEEQLSSSASRNARWRFVYAHTPVYSGGEHGKSGIAAFEKLCDTYGVHMVFNGHDHGYERTYPLYNKIANKTPGTASEKAGTIYIVTGGGGAPLYSFSKNWWTSTYTSSFHYCDIKTSETALVFTAYKADGSVIDNFTVTKERIPTTEVINPIDTGTSTPPVVEIPESGTTSGSTGGDDTLAIPFEDPSEGLNHCGTGAGLALLVPLVLAIPRKRKHN